jgi:hypothetical protein
MERLRHRLAATIESPGMLRLVEDDTAALGLRRT